MWIMELLVDVAGSSSLLIAALLFLILMYPSLSEASAPWRTFLLCDSIEHVLALEGAEVWPTLGLHKSSSKNDVTSRTYMLYSRWASLWVGTWARSCAEVDFAPDCHSVWPWEPEGLKLSNLWPQAVMLSLLKAVYDVWPYSAPVLNQINTVSGSSWFLPFEVPEKYLTSAIAICSIFSKTLGILSSVFTWILSTICTGILGVKKGQYSGPFVEHNTFQMKFDKQMKEKVCQTNGGSFQRLLQGSLLASKLIYPRQTKMVAFIQHSS